MIANQNRRAAVLDIRPLPSIHAPQASKDLPAAFGLRVLLAEDVQVLSC
jgi:hypothetical protein